MIVVTYDCRGRRGALVSASEQIRGEGDRGDTRGHGAGNRRHVSAAVALARAHAAEPARGAGKGSGDLAALDLVGPCSRSPPARCGTASTGTCAWRSRGDHRREPAAPVRGHAREPVTGCDPGADVPGRDCRSDGLRLSGRADRIRDRRGPGTGRQAAPRARTVPCTGPYHFRGTTSPPPLRSAAPAFVPLFALARHLPSR